MKTFLLILLLSLVATGVWLFEILSVKGWYSLTWLSGPLYSPYAAILFVVFAFLTPFIVNKQVTKTKLIISVIILYAVSILCFKVGEQLCYTLYCRFCFWERNEIILLLSIAFSLFLLTGFAYWFVAHKLLKKNKKINILYLTLLSLLIVPLSLLSIRVNKGFGHGTDWVDAVKMGYPLFWTAFILGVCGVLISRQHLVNKRGGT